MTSRHTRSNAQGPLHQLTNEELARLERQNRQLPRPTSTNMGDHQDDLTAAFALMQQQMQQMQQTIQANAANQRNAPEEVDQLIKSNQNHVFIMEESPQDKGTIDATSEADQATEDHHEVSYVNGQRWQFKNYHPNPNVRNNPHLFNNPKPDGNTENAQGNQVQNSGYQRGYGNQGRTFKESEQPPVTAPADEEEAELPVKHTPTTTEQPTVVVRPVAEPVPTRDYVPKVPYPVPAKATRKDKEEMKCRKMLEDLTVRLPLMSAIQMMPSMNDPLELALTRAEAEQNVQNIDADGYAKMLDSARTMERLVFEYHMEFLETFGCIWSSKEVIRVVFGRALPGATSRSDYMRSLCTTSRSDSSRATARSRSHDPGATSQSDLPRSLPIQSDPLERHTIVARDLSPGDTKNRPWSDFPERHLQVAPRYFAAENHDFLRTFLQFILDEDPLAVNEVEGLEGQEELCFINNNGSWYKKEPNFQYNNYQQKSYPNNQQSGYPPRNNQQRSYQPQQNPSSGSSAPQESSTDTLLKQILESQTRSEKHVGYELKNLHTKIDGSYNELNNKFSHLASTSGLWTSTAWSDFSERLHEVAVHHIPERLIQNDCTKSLAFSHPETHIFDPGATFQSDVLKSLPIQSDPLERHTKVARDLSPGDTKNRPWSDFPERHLQVAPRYFAAENYNFLGTFLQFEGTHQRQIIFYLWIIGEIHKNSIEKLKADSLIDHLPSLVRYLITQGLIPMPMNSLFP
ncbi:hypothetical protein IGI04_008075 [Brassica rapa subsp. trilocularis]|uniref:Uncharacterized protein n=1 Tax=Brassica rapa subsp. trilocularis TaxID=1813537 RepID=A0ABQ7NNN0_BRACM|nr:hypothetical protein IGI04_008075 [Brassica rapa subsp. trilocularis]